MALEMMVPRFRSRNQSSLRPVNRIKHVIDGQFGTALGVANDFNLILTVDNPVLANRTECATGSKVNGIYLKVESYATTGGALSNIYFYIMKNPGGNLVLPAANAVGASDNKKYVFHQEMVMLQKEPTADSLGGNPRTIFNGVIAIPKGYRRNGPNDVTIIRTFAPGVDADVCVQAHYKEFR